MAAEPELHAPEMAPPPEVAAWAEDRSPSAQQNVVAEPSPVVDDTVSDVASNCVPQAGSLEAPLSSENDRMPSPTKPSRKRPAPRGKTLSVRTKPKATAAAQHGARGIAFRLSREHVRILAAEVQALNKVGKGNHSPSDVLRSLLVTHLLIDNPRIDGVLFLGGYKACRKGAYWVVLSRSGKELEAYRAVGTAKDWSVVDRHGKTIGVATGDGDTTILDMSAKEAARAARDISFLRAEWLAQIGTGSVVKPEETSRRKDDTKAFRLPNDERIALQRLAIQNGTTLSQVLRSLLTTQLAQRKGRLHEVTIGGCRIYPCSGGWSVRKRRSIIQVVGTLKEAFRGAEWEAKRAA